MRNGIRLETEQAIARALLILTRQGIGRTELEVELARRYPVDLDLLGQVMAKLHGKDRQRRSLAT